jgi:hypothetical protein
MRLRSWLTVCWALLPAVSLGLLAIVPALHAAFRLRRRSLWATAITYGLLTLVATTLMSSDPNSGTAGHAGTRGGVGVALLLGGAVVATVHAFMLRVQVFPSVAAMRTPLRDDPAVAAAVAAAQRRQHAHALADRDPALAREVAPTQVARQVARKAELDEPGRQPLLGLLLGASPVGSVR